MKNLKLLEAASLSITGECFCADSEDNLYFGSRGAILCYNRRDKKISPCRGNVDDHLNESGVSIIGMEYVIEHNAICFGLSSGLLILYGIYEEKVIDVASVNSELQCFAFSPDQYLVVSIGGNDVIMMTMDFQIIKEHHNLSEDEIGEKNSVAVGWGSKETQFHGSEGKGAAHVKEKKISSSLPFDDHSPRISWRSDGAFFVVSVIIAQKGYRQLKIYSRDCVLQYVSELTPGLEPVIAWKPGSDFIACGQHENDKHKVAFFEKNGLLYDDFPLPFQSHKFKVRELLWNSDSTILAMCAESVVKEDSSSFKMLFWIKNNNHWYLKQMFPVTLCQHNEPIFAQWSCSANEFSCYFTISQLFISLTFASVVSHSPGMQPNDENMVISIDNDVALVTPFQKIIVPPPLCAYSVHAASEINEVFFSPSCEEFALYLKDDKLAFFRKEGPLSKEIKGELRVQLVAASENSEVKPYKYVGSYILDYPTNVDPPVSRFVICHWTWTARQKLICVCHPTGIQNPFIMSVDTPEEFQEGVEKLVAKHCFALDTSVICMATNMDGSKVAVQMKNGKIFSLKPETNEFVPWYCKGGKELILPQSSPKMSIISISNQEYVLSLSDRYKLHCNSNLLLSDCTSFCVHNEFLMTTSTDSKLRIFPNTVLLKSPLLPAIQQDTEKAAKIITSSVAKGHVILQAPRGNLEVIKPKFFVYLSVCELIERKEFRAAYDISITHKLDLNLLYDHNPTNFLENIEIVIDQIKIADDLNILLTSFRNDNVAKSFKSSFYGHPEQKQCSHDKIDIICDAFQKVLEKKNDIKYIQVLMANFAKRNKLEEALIALKQFKDNNVGKDINGAIDSAIKCLLYFADVSVLCDVALGTYDFEITRTVIERSNKDPKEYVIILNELHDLDDDYKKYKIDIRLKRYKKALQHLTKCGDHFEQCISLIKDQRLYVDALYLFSPDSVEFKAVWKEYGNYLMSKGYFDEAGIAFTKIEDHRSALEAYVKALNWRLALHAAMKLTSDGIDIVILCETLCEKLQESGNYVDAAFIKEVYLHDAAESIKLLIKAQKWNYAIYLMEKYQLNDFREILLKPALEEYTMNLIEYLEELQNIFMKYITRLKEIKSRQTLNSFVALKEADNDPNFSDVTSEVSTAEFSGSLLTRASSRRKRKQDRKIYRWVIGSENEDETLIMLSSEIITKVDNLKDDFVDTLKTLVMIGYDASAKTLQKNMGDLSSLIEKEMSYIWEHIESANNANQMTFGPESTSNRIASMHMIQRKSITNCKQTPLWRRGFTLALPFFKE